LRLLAAASVAIFALTACVDGPSRPTTPTYSGNQRPNPTRPPRPGEPLPSAPVSTKFADSRSAYMPRHIPNGDRRDLKRIAVMLPFSSPDPDVRKLANALFNAIQMSLFEVGAQDVVLMPRDSGTDPESSGRAAQDAIKDGAVAVVGPLFAQQIPSVAQEASRVGAPVFSFSTDTSAIGGGAYLMSLTPQTEIDRIVDWASTQGVNRFAMFGPDTEYGHIAETALNAAAARHGAVVIDAEYYKPSDNSPQAPAKRLSERVKAEDKASPGKVAVLIPERGVQLRTVASLLPYFDVNVRQVKFLGTGAWNDSAVWREPALFGGAFPAPDPNLIADFDKRYQAAFGEPAPKLASFGYDAGALAAALAKGDRLDAAMVQRQEGFAGVNGLFRFLGDGSIQRALTVMQIEPGGGVKVISPAVVAFSPGS
jgi:ABC-type branched-subunit amino acid transport system substrate-binding protein